MDYIRITKENIDKEHICCAMSGQQSLSLIHISRTETVPPAGVNLMALDSRFSKIWFSRVLSQ